MDEIVNRIKSHFDIVEVISDCLPLKRAGKDFRALCPFHEERTASFFVSPSRQTFHCFGCGASGDVIAFIMKFNKITFKEALDTLSGKVGGHYIVPDPSPKTNDRKTSIDPRLTPIPHTFLSLDGSENCGRPLEYLLGRGVTRLQIAMYDIGYIAAPGRYRDRLIFPIYVKGEIQGFAARAIEKLAPGPKYLYPKGMKKSGCLLGYDIASGFRNCVLVEGMFDMLRVGFDAIAILGSFLSAEQVALLYSAGFQRITVMLDSDAFEKSIGICRQLSPYFEVHQVFLDDGDPGDHDHREIRRLIEESPKFGSDKNFKEIIDERVHS